MFSLKVETEDSIKVNRECGTSKGNDAASPLTLRHLQGVFYVLFLSWVVGGAILLLELFTVRHKDCLVPVCRR